MGVTFGAPTSRGRRSYGIDCDPQNQKRAMLSNLFDHFSRCLRDESSQAKHGEECNETPPDADMYRNNLRSGTGMAGATSNLETIWEQ